MTKNGVALCLHHRTWNSPKVSFAQEDDLGCAPMIFPTKWPGTTMVLSTSEVIFINVDHAPGNQTVHPQKQKNIYIYIYTYIYIYIYIYPDLPNCRKKTKCPSQLVLQHVFAFYLATARPMGVTFSLAFLSPPISSVLFVLMVLMMPPQDLGPETHEMHCALS